MSSFWHWTFRPTLHVESLSSGCPVLIGNETPWRDLVSNQAGWDLPVSNLEAFRATLQCCIEMNEAEHREWRAGARALAAAVVVDDAAVRSNRDLFVQAMHQGTRERAPRHRPARQVAPDFPIADSKYHFEAIAPSWEKKYARGGAFHRRAASFVRCLQQFVPVSSRVLDFGCGSGDIALACSEAGYEITGIDLSSAMIARARLRSYGRGIAFDLLDSDDSFKLPYRDAYFDGVIASSVLEYVRNPFECLKELRRVSKPRAVLIATVPNARHPQRWLEVVLRHPLIRKGITAINRCRPYGEYLGVSRNRFPLRDWAALFGLGGWQMETVQAKVRSLLMLVAWAAVSGQIQGQEHDSHGSEHVLQTEA